MPNPQKKTYTCDCKDTPHKKSCSIWKNLDNPQKKEECPYCNIDIELPKHDEELFQWHLGGHLPIQEKEVQNCQACDNYICECKVKDFVANTEPWEIEFDKKFNSADFDALSKYPFLATHIKSFIRSVEERAYQKGQEEARCHYYDKVRREAIEDERERIITIIQAINTDGGGNGRRIKALLLEALSANQSI